MIPPKPRPLTIPEFRTELEYLLRTLEALADHPDDRIADLAQRVHWLMSVRPRGA